MKYLTSTYLKDIEKYKLSLFFEKDYCISVKKVIETKQPFILKEDGRDIIIIDKDFYILEYMPFDQNYICRIHINDTKNIIEWFYLATRNNRVINGIPAFEDLKLSYVIVNKSNIKKLYNVGLARKFLNENDFNLAFSQLSKVKKEIKDKINFVYKLNYKQYLV